VAVKGLQATQKNTRKENSLNAMKKPINFQTLERNGKPLFAVVPYDEFLRLLNPEHRIPHEVIGMVLKKGMSLTRAWREYLGMTQEEVAQCMGITQAALSQIENPNTKPRKTTLVKLAKALKIDPEQLRE